ncbi:tripartite tricarboxylate transporter TctB family protein [Mesobacillus maritimus]|uniref:tripartite tricarboxylate transporter TctB family protein n=1 Tax=Mesobacillus maritimus TaxID=1643336 RepID=UPI002040456E|nr:tripartite tricarboxylate transporter TctB family protein [Mesobacillus maritimus]MCM3584805.1 tripartite tricarboxylate transporter TctB family protein [Mesobacillus maritimus]MCM3671218.1 tripartite tricarboxylate transporter TctB family protein [Mesobacillus maritimus]
MTFLSEKKIGGFIAVLLGILSLYEASLLYPYSRQLLTGDHTLPGLIGILLVLFGISMFVEKQKPNRVEFPTGKVLYTLVATIIILFLYCFLLTVIGYAISTFAVSFLLFKLIGKKRWIVSLIIGGVLTATFYYLFIVLLKTPFPSGILFY